jgi:hypothetical protein
VTNNILEEADENLGSFCGRGTAGPCYSGEYITWKIICVRCYDTKKNCLEKETTFLCRNLKKNSLVIAFNRFVVVMLIFKKGLKYFRQFMRYTFTNYRIVVTSFLDNWVPRTLCKHSLASATLASERPGSVCA